MTILRRIYERLPVIRELRQLTAANSRLADHTAALRKIHANAYVQAGLRDARYDDARRLTRAAAQINSQNGEDGMIHEILRRLDIKPGVFVEVGVGDGSQNNSAFLLSQGWRGFWIEGAPLSPAVERVARSWPQGTLKTKTASVTRENIGALFSELGVPDDFALLSLDIDLNTFYAWEGLPHVRPAVIVVEYNAALPADVDWVVDYHADRMWDGTVNFGASLKAFERLGRERGYSLVGCDFVGVNAYFVRNDLVGDKFAEPFTAENHHEPPRYFLAGRNIHAPAFLDRRG